jgi:gliding motility-associated-like protein
LPNATESFYLPFETIRKQAFMIGRIFLFLLTIIGCTNCLYGQGTILNRGDLAVLAVNANYNAAKDEISFVCFKDITNGTEIQILDAGYENCTAGLWSCGQEGGAKMVRTGGTIPAGTVMTFRTDPVAFVYPDANWAVTDLFTSSNANYSVLSSNLNINAGGDQVYFAQGGVWTEQSTLCTINGNRTSPNVIYPGNNGRVLFGFSTNGWSSLQQSSSESGLYPGMQCFSMSPTGGTAYNKYTGPLTTATQTVWISRISSTANWTTYSSSANYYAASPVYNIANYTIPITAGGGIPTATWTAPSSQLCSDGASINLNNLITGTTGGTWSGTGVSGNTFNPTGLNGNYNITYSVNYISSSNNCPITQTSTITVNALLTVNAVANQSVCNGSSTAAINFSGTGNAIYNWTNNTPSIGLAANGTGNIASFTALNSGTAAVTASITVTPTPVAYAYVANYGVPLFNPGNLSIVNTATNAVTGTITLGSNPFGVSVTPDGSKAYITNFGSNNVSVISTATNTVSATIPVGNSPMGIVVSPDATRVYVVNQGSIFTPGTPGTVSVINTATNTVIATITVSLQPQGICISPDGSKVYVANVNSNNVSVINTATNTVSTVIGVGTQPITVAIAPDGSRLYVPNFGNNNVSVINTATNAVITTVNVGTNPNGAAISPDGSKVYITNQNFANVSVINTGTNTVAATIAVGSQPQGVSFTSDGTKAYIANFGSNSISVINIATNTVSSTVTVGTAPHSLGNFITPNSGCSGIPTTFTITVNPVPEMPTTTVVQPSCSLLTGSITVTAPVGGGYTYSIDGTNFQTGVTFSNIFPGPYTLTVKNGGGCTNSTGFTINTPTNAPPSPTVLPVAYCHNATATALTATGSNLLWYTVASGGTGSSIAPTPSTSTVGITNYYVSQTTGCESPRSLIVVTVNTLPTINTVSNQSVCNGSNTATINFSGTGTAMYNWTNNNPSIGLPASGTGTIASFTALNSGTTPVTATITATPVSTGYAYVTNSDPAPNSAVSYVSVINTATDAVIGNVTVGSRPFGVSVSPDGSKVYVANSTNSTVSVINTATNTVTATIFVGAPPIQPRGIVVSTDGSKVYVTAIPGATPLTTPATLFVIDALTNTVIASVTLGIGSQSVCVSPDGTKVYVNNVSSNDISVINANTNTVATTIAVGSQPQAISISPDGSKLYVPNAASNNVSIINTATNSVMATVPNVTTPSCSAVSPDGTNLYIANQNINSVSVINTATNAITATIAVGSSPRGISFTSDGTKAYVVNVFSNNVSVINTVTNAVITTVPVGISPLCYGNFITPNSGCAGAPTTFTITVNPKPEVPVTTLVQPTCSSPTGSITVTAPVGSGYTYSIDGTNFQSSATFTNLVVNSYTVTVKNTSGCINTNSVNLSSVSTMPVPTVSITQPTCSQPTGTVSIISPIGNTFEYSIDGTNFNFMGTFTGLAPGPYTMTVRNQGGCSNSAPFTINAIPTPPIAPTVTTPVTLCQNATATALIATGSNLLWYTSATGGTGSSTAQIPSTAIVSSSTYYVSQSTNGCESARTGLTVDIIASPPTPTIAANGATNFCEGGGVTLTSSTAINIQWYRDGAILNGSTNPDYIAMQPGVYTVSVSSTNNCTTSSVGTTVTIFPNPVLSLNPNVLVNENDSARLLLTASQGNLFTYLWSPSIYLNDATVAQPWTKPLMDTYYTVTVTNENSCTSTANVTVTVLKEIIVPNAFSPNGDHVNDAWEIPNLSIYPYCSVEVFARSGQLIYKSVGYSKAWDGTYNGKPVPVGVYYYIINLKNGKQVKSGNVTLLR